VYEEEENIQPNDDLTTLPGFAVALRGQVEQDAVQIAHSYVRKDQLDQEKANADVEVGDRIRLKNPEHAGVVMRQGDAILQGKLKQAALLRKNEKKDVRGGGVRKRAGKGRAGGPLVEKGGPRGGRGGGRARGGGRGGGRGKSGRTRRFSWSRRRGWRKLVRSQMRRSERWRWRRILGGYRR